ncbi:MAG: hypothetical protein C4547_14065 [Phycisphaerales bacterium]|nr:MAG: hypothetical protein C4547_14065 [Phycisphaerales bacterium]
MHPHRDPFRLGLAVLTMAALLVACTLWIGRGLFRPHETIVVLFPTDLPLPILDAGSQVIYGTQRIGEVVSISLEPGSDGDHRGPVARVTAQIDPSADLRADCRVVAVGPPLGGPGTLEVTRRGDAGVRLSAAGPVYGTAGGIAAQLSRVTAELDAANPESLLAQIKLQLDAGRPDSLAAKLAASLDHLRSAMARIDAETDPSERAAIMAKLHGILDNVNRLTESLRDQAEVGGDATIAARVNDALALVNRSLADLADMIAENRAMVRDTVTDVAGTARTVHVGIVQPLATELDPDNEAGVRAALHAAVERLNRTLADVESVAASAERTMLLNQDRVDQIIANVKETSDHLKATGKDIRRNPWRLLYKPTPKEQQQLDVFDAAREFTEAAARLDDSLERLERIRRLSEQDVAVDESALKNISDILKATLGRFQEAETRFWDRLDAG